MKIVWTYWRDE